jgi:6-pyruvoyltetrahydropterin/6-carboxytetrahydropterin synthase
MYELTLQTDFAAAHRLREYEGKCESLHGHNYHVELVLGGCTLNDIGMLIDFKEAKAIAGEVVDRLDHEYLNETEPFDRINPTTEQIAAHIAEEVAGRLPAGVEVRSVTCWESEKCAARYIPEAE